MRQVLLTMFVAMLLAFAGCTDGALPSEEPDTESLTPTNEGQRSGTEDRENSSEGTADGDEQNPEGELEFHHLDVGQADSTVVITPGGETILIDSGDWRQDGSAVISYLKERGIDQIDHLVTTHGHADHIGGHAAVIEYFEEERDGIGAIYDPGVPHTSQTYESYLDSVEEYDVQLFEVQEGDELPVDNITVTAVNPLAGTSGDGLDDNSLALTIEFGDITYLTTGDAGSDAEQRLVDEWAADLEADIYQAGHHGSSTSSSPSFLETVDPEIAIISSAHDSQYGHPHDEVLAEFAERDLETYWTGVHGTIVITTDGASIQVDPEREFSSDPAELLEEKPQEDTAVIHRPLFERILVPATA